MSGTNDPPGYRPPEKPPTDAVHRTDPPKPARPLPPARPAATPAPVPATAQQQEPKKKEISVFAAPPPEPMSANKKLAIVGAIVFALYVVYWMSTAFTGMTF